MYVLMQKQHGTTAKKMDWGAEAAANVRQKKMTSLVWVWKRRERMK
jgi:hypothetical protein